MKVRVTLQIDTSLLALARQAVRQHRPITLAGLIRAGLHHQIRLIERLRGRKLRPFHGSLSAGRPRTRG